MFREEKRDRFLNPDELKRALAAIDQEADWRWKAYFKFSLLLGPRRSELLSARWVDIDLQTCTWRLPTTKAGARTCCPCRRPPWRFSNRCRVADNRTGCSRRPPPRQGTSKSQKSLAAHPDPGGCQGRSDPRPPPHVGILACGEPLWSSADRAGPQSQPAVGHSDLCSSRPRTGACGTRGECKQCSAVRQQGKVSGYA